MNRYLFNLDKPKKVKPKPKPKKKVKVIKRAKPNDTQWIMDKQREEVLMRFLRTERGKVQLA